MTETIAKPKEEAPELWHVRVSHPISNKRIVFRSTSERRARQWLMNRSPRGEEFHLVRPDGGFESYVTGRMNEDGSDADEWQPFDPEAYIPHEMQLPPGSSGWPDIES
jgi:hypothetical protein